MEKSTCKLPPTGALFSVTDHEILTQIFAAAFAIPKADGIRNSAELKLEKRRGLRDLGAKTRACDCHLPLPPRSLRSLGSPRLPMYLHGVVGTSNMPKLGISGGLSVHKRRAKFEILHCVPILVILMNPAAQNATRKQLHGTRDARFNLAHCEFPHRPRRSASIPCRMSGQGPWPSELTSVGSGTSFV